jgi:glycosyltransferase involved in cell wall biosynthesis
VTIDVSVVIPFFNPGPDIDDCVASMLAQSLAAHRFEVILVDDGSTDGSDALVDAWVARYPQLLSVLHLPASGGPAHPRNVGIDTARGRFIQFVDSDDTLAPTALERLIDIADESDADVVVGKISSDFRGVNQPFFRTTVTHRTLADYPLMQNLTVCKMFRREFLLAHGIRLPEGPSYIEDQHLCVTAYAHATSVAVVADTVCYQYRRRRSGGSSHGDTQIEAAAYCRELGEIFTIIDTQISTPPSRTSAYTRYYRNEMLGRLRGAAMLEYDDDYRHELVSELRQLAMNRLPADVHAELAMFQRVQSRLLLAGDEGGLLRFAQQLERVTLLATTSAPHWRNGILVIDVEAGLHVDDQPLRLERHDDNWLLPASFAPGLDPDERRMGAADAASLDLDLATRSRSDGALWSTTEGLRLDIGDDGAVRFRGEVAIDPLTLMGGAALTPGLWAFSLRAIFGGISWSSRLRPAPGPLPSLRSWLTVADRTHRSDTAYWTAGETPALSLDVDEWLHALVDLVDDASASRATIEAGDELVIPVPRLSGRGGESIPVHVSLGPVDDQRGPVGCAAQLVLHPDESCIRLRVLPLAAGPERWAVWLRIGAIGSGTPRRLPIELVPGRLGRLRVEGG